MRRMVQSPRTHDATPLSRCCRRMPTDQAHRILKARRLIRAAYGIDPKVDAARIVRYDLIGDTVAVVRLRDHVKDSPSMTIRVAQQLPSGRVKQLRKANRTGLTIYPDAFIYLETLHAVYGG